MKIMDHCAAGLGVLAFMTALSSLALPQEPAPSQSRPGDQYTIRVDVNMVILRATVQDHKNVLVSGLDKDNFQIYENGMLQPIKQFSHEDISVTVGLVIDNSGSIVGDGSRERRHFSPGIGCRVISLI